MIRPMRRQGFLTENSPRAARFLESALLFNLFIHAVAMLSMAGLLLPGMPGGPVRDVLARAAYVAGHPWAWRLGWLPWQLTAGADFLLSLALALTPWVPRGPAIATLLLTIAAMFPDQIGQFLWITHGVVLARQSVAGSNSTIYLHFEGSIFTLIGGIGCIGYLCGAIGWSWCLARAGTWSRRLTWLSFATWGTFATCIVLFFLPPSMRPTRLIAAGNAIGFVLLELWFIGVAERVLARSRPTTRFGRGMPWRYPRPGWIGCTCEAFASSHVARRVTECLPAPPLVSDIRDVIYVNYLVEADRLRPLVPEGLELQCLGPLQQSALFTVLIYRHGHFGPSGSGWFRGLMPSPIQSNWRVYVTDAQTGLRGVYFITTAITNLWIAVMARLFAEGVPMHLPELAELESRSDGTFHVLIAPGQGSAPDLRACLRPISRPPLPASWTECFLDYHEFLEYCVPQNRALAPQPWYRRVAHQQIDLSVPPENCRALDGPVQSTLLRQLVGDIEPVSFRLPAVTFHFQYESFGNATVKRYARLSNETTGPLSPAPDSGITLPISPTD